MKINYLALLACVIANQVVGMLWFGFIFGNTWTSLNGFTSAQVQAGGHPISYVFSIIEGLFWALLLNWLFRRMGIRSANQGMRTAFVIGFAIIIFGMITNYSFSERSISLALIDGFYPVISMTIMGAILGGWKTKLQRMMQTA